MSDTIDIVIPCAGRVSDLMRLLESLHRHCTALRTDVRSITASDDRPSETMVRSVRARFPDVRCIDGPRRGPAANRNHGARHGTAEWILFLDDDCYADSDLLAAYRTQLRVDPQADVVEGAIHPVGPRPNGNHHAPLNLAGGKLWSCNVLIRRRVFEAIEGFDERFPYACMEDVDLHERLAARGATISFAPAAAVRHPWRSISEREVTRQIISHAIYAQKHPAFAARFGLLRTARMVWGKVRAYRTGRFGSIPLRSYRTVAYDFVAPLALLAVVRLPPLRRALHSRYRNPSGAA